MKGAPFAEAGALEAMLDRVPITSESNRSAVNRGRQGQLQWLSVNPIVNSGQSHTG